MHKHHIVKAYRVYISDPSGHAVSKAWACSCSLAGTVGANAAWGKECLSLVRVGCC